MPDDKSSDYNSQRGGKEPVFDDAQKSVNEDKEPDTPPPPPPDRKKD